MVKQKLSVCVKTVKGDVICSDQVTTHIDTLMDLFTTEMKEYTVNKTDTPLWKAYQKKVVQEINESVIDPNMSLSNMKGSQIFLKNRTARKDAEYLAENFFLVFRDDILPAKTQEDKVNAMGRFVADVID